MTRLLNLCGAGLALAVLTAGTVQAATYALTPGPLALGVTPSAGAFDANFGSKSPVTFTDDFTFTTNSRLSDGFAVILDEYPSVIDKISAVDLSVYAGTPTDPGKLIETGDFTADESDPVVSEFLPAVVLGPGSYFLQAEVTVPGGDLAYYTAQAAPAPAPALPPTVSAAPEPTTWTLMIAGVAAVGLGLRRRQSFASGRVPAVA
jgi:hypothetical protein